MSAERGGYEHRRCLRARDGRYEGTYLGFREFDDTS